MAKAIAFATSRHRQPAPDGPQRPGQRPPRPWRALLARRGKRWPLALRAEPTPVDPAPAGGGEAAPRLLPPGQRRVRVHTHRRHPHGEGHRLRHRATLLPARSGLKGPASARPAPGGRLPLTSRAAPSSVDPAPAGGGEAAPRLLPPGHRRVRVCTHHSWVQWRRLSPSPPRTIGKRHRTGLKGPASARPPLGGRFSPARSGAGLCHLVP